jgi:hypothetical protein
MNDHNTAVEKLVAEAKKVNGPDDYNAAVSMTFFVTTMVMLLILYFGKPTDAEALAFTQFFWPWATHYDFLLPHTVVLIVSMLTPPVVVWQLIKSRDELNRGKLSQMLEEALATPHFTDAFNASLEEVIGRRVKRVRRYENGEVGHAILAPTFKNFLPDVVPAESIDESRLAHLYRSLAKDDREKLMAVCPKISEMRIGVVQASPLDAFSTKEVR